MINPIIFLYRIECKNKKKTKKITHLLAKPEAKKISINQGKNYTTGKKKSNYLLCRGLDPVGTPLLSSRETSQEAPLQEELN